MPKHFGVTVRNTDKGLKLERNKYANINKKRSLGIDPFIDKYPDKYEDLEGTLYSDEWCKNHYERCMKNFDLNMEFFSTLKKDEFEDTLSKFLKKNKKFISVADLNTYSNKPGYYLMVLDEYKQLYLGSTDNIKRRVMQHWSNTKSFDRLIFGEVENSILSIDSFRAFDTTRLYVYPTSKTFLNEDKLIQQIPPKFLSNRTAGGLMDLGLHDACANRKTRDLK
jgi:hypothetical protein